MTSINQILRKGPLKCGRTFRLWYTASLQSPFKPLHHVKQISSSSRVLKLLSESTTINQDGVTIEELPILIRRATKDSYPFTSHSYCGENIREETEFDSSFKEMLQNCDSVHDVFTLLEVPSDQVQGHSAVYALQRLHVLMSLNTDWKQIHSFIRKAVIGELYYIVERDIRRLSNFSLVSLIDCYFTAEGFSPTCFEALHQEISHRLVEGLFSMEELLSLIQSLRTGPQNSGNSKLPGTHISDSSNTLKDVLSENASVFLSVGRPKIPEPSSESDFNAEGFEKCKELLRNAWIHLVSRCSDLDENTLPWTMQLLSSDKKMLIPLLDKQMTYIWPQLSADTAAMCLDNLIRLRTYNSSMMTNLGKWAVVNIHLMTPSVLLSFLNAYQHFMFTNTNFVQVMERCISKTGIDTPTDVLALCVEYLRSCKYVSPIIMDVAANHFCHHWESYTPLEIFAVLRSFGHLGYLPVKSQDFLFKAEMCLDKRFDFLDEAQLLEVLASFTFVNILPKNFYKRVTSGYFFKKVGALKNPSRTSALMWLKIMKHGIILGSSEVDLKRNLKWVMERRKKWSVFLFHDNERAAILSMKSALNQLFGPHFHHVIPFYCCSALYLDKEGIPIRICRQDGYPKPEHTPAQSLVILLRSSSHFTSNTRQLLGAHQQKMTHLKKLGFSILEIRAGEFLYQPGTDILKTHLSQFVNFENSNVADLEQKRMTELEEKYLKDWMEDGVDGEGEDIHFEDSDGELLACADVDSFDTEFSLPFDTNGENED